MALTEEQKILERIDKATKNYTKQEAIHRKAVKIHEFIKSNQWINVNSAGHVTDIGKDESYWEEHREYRPRPVINIVFPIYRTYLAYLLKTRPRIQASPESYQDVMDILGARVATKLMEYIYKTVILEQYLDQCNQILKYGTSVLHEFWNPELKEIEALAIPPSQIFPYPPGVKNWKDLRGIVWRYRVPTEILKEDYPDKEISSDGSTADWGYLSALDADYDDTPHTTVDDIWWLPRKSDPGTMARVASGGVFLWGPTKKYPYDMTDRKGRVVLPFTPYHDNYLGGEFFGFPLLGLILQAQEDYNEGKSNLMQLRKIMPKLLIDIATKSDPDFFTDPDSKILEYRGIAGKQPSYTSPPQVSPILWQDLMKTPEEAEHTAGFHEVTGRSEPPGSIQSGLGVEKLQSKDELRLLPALEWQRRGLITTFQKFYALAHKYPTQKLKDILGEMGEIDIITFKDIKLSPMNFTIEEASFSPYAQQVRQQKIAAILPYNVIRLEDPWERRKVLQYFDEELADTLDVTSKDEKRARMENKLMLEGKKVEVGPDDPDEIDIPCHNIIRKDFRFDLLKKPIRDEFNRHINDHKLQGKEKFDQAIEAKRKAEAPAKPEGPEGAGMLPGGGM
jgi:hypothetical protein